LHADQLPENTKNAYKKIRTRVNHLTSPSKAFREKGIASMSEKSNQNREEKEGLRGKNEGAKEIECIP